MQLSSKLIKYTCIETGNKLKINGTVIVGDGEFTFSGNFNTLQSRYCGDFIYSEKDKVTTSINNTTSELIEDCYQFLLEVVNKLKLTILNFD